MTLLWSLALAFFHVDVIGVAGGNWRLYYGYTLHWLRHLHHLHGLHGSCDSGGLSLLGVTWAFGELLLLAFAVDDDLSHQPVNETHNCNIETKEDIEDRLRTSALVFKVPVLAKVTTVVKCFKCCDNDDVPDDSDDEEGDIDPVANNNGFADTEVFGTAEDQRTEDTEDYGDDAGPAHSDVCGERGDAKDDL